MDDVDLNLLQEQLEQAHRTIVQWEARTEAAWRREDQLGAQVLSYQARILKTMDVLNEWERCLADPTRRPGWSGAGILADLRKTLRLRAPVVPESPEPAPVHWIQQGTTIHAVSEPSQIGNGGTQDWGRVTCETCLADRPRFDGGDSA